MNLGFRRVGGRNDLDLVHHERRGGTWNDPYSCFYCGCGFDDDYCAVEEISNGSSSLRVDRPRVGGRHRRRLDNYYSTCRRYCTIIE